jgi:hypothetical protein
MGRQPHAKPPKALDTFESYLSTHLPRLETAAIFRFVFTNLAVATAA